MHQVLFDINKPRPLFNETDFLLQINMVSLANSTLTASAYYPIPLFGPILAGTLISSMGLFIPFTKGMHAIEKNTPWAIQAAFMSALFYHLMVNDTKGVLGIGLRAIVGTYSQSTVTMIISFCQILHLELQYIISPDLNLFTPLHKLLYMIFQVEGPKLVAKPPLLDEEGEELPYVGWDPAARFKLKILVEALRVIIVITVLLLHTYLFVIPTSMNAVTLPASMSSKSFSSTQVILTLPAKDLRYLERYSVPFQGAIGVCQWLPQLRFCKPYSLKFESPNKGSYRLALYDTPSSKFFTNNTVSYNKSATPLFTTPTASFLKKDSEPFVVVTSKGQVLMIGRTEESGGSDQGISVSIKVIGSVTVPTGMLKRQGCGKLLPAGGAALPANSTVTRLTIDYATGHVLAKCKGEAIKSKPAPVKSTPAAKSTPVKPAPVKAAPTKPVPAGAKGKEL